MPKIKIVLDGSISIENKVFMVCPNTTIWNSVSSFSNLPEISVISDFMEEGLA
jgi:hypothetical protein